MAAIGKQPDVPPQAAKIEHPDRNTCSKTEAQGEQHRSVVWRDGHAFCIHFQADQNPSAAPSISNGAVQNSPEPSVRSSQRPANTPISIGVTMIQPSTPI